MNEDTKTEKATVYEVGFHIVPTVSPEHLAVEVEAVKGILGKVGATIIGEEFPRMIPLSYPMLKVVGPKRDYFETAYFGWVKFEAEPKAAVELKNALDLSEKVLRFLIVKTVRENTMHGHKFAKDGRDSSRRPSSTERKPDAVKPEVTAEELDKSIDKLVIE
jgi:ribosomal protein S6